MKPRKRRSRRSHASKHNTLVVGFVPMIDCAVLIAAQELGLFRKHGLHVSLSRELGWATIREKLLHQELDAAHAPASLGYTIHCGIGSVARPCLTAFVLSLNGSAITLSERLWQKGVRDAATLRTLIEKERGETVYSFGAVLEFSTQNYDLRKWLRGGGIDPDRDVRIPMIPSPLIHKQLLEGNIDGYCVGEPWNSIAVHAGAGWIVAASADLSPRQPEKVLLVLETFAEERAEEHEAMVAALIEASIFCEQPSNCGQLIQILSQPQYLDVPAPLLAISLCGPLETGHGERSAEEFIVFHRGQANVPDRAKGKCIFDQVRAMPAARGSKAMRPGIVGRIFRDDLYHRAAVSLRFGPRGPGASEHPLTTSDADPAAPLPMALAG